MSNEIHIARTEFRTFGADGATVYTSYGYRIYDNEFATYTNMFETLDEILSYSPVGLVEHASQLDRIGMGLVSSAEELRHPIIVDGWTRVFCIDGAWVEI
ncbi:hypothetical protein [Hoeflea alexandrii]|uniref:hypothetical protein n=1 Tax=Hoeflea alexandrii TaxID=288436 RepID=UPI00226FA380|nr:hypothetical protein [Hoeflea alexandrii]MCY0154992.1 hypothetical protein [Hoeflea alexandrii]